MEADTGDDVYGRYPIVCKRRDCMEINRECEDTEHMGAAPHPAGGAGCPRRLPVLNDCSRRERRTRWRAAAHPGTALTVEEATV